MNVAAMRTKSVFIFAAHQIVGTWGIGFLAALGLTSLFDAIPDSVSWKPSMRLAYWLLTETPFYPVQIVAGLFFCLVVFPRLPPKNISLVFVLPPPAPLFFLAVVPTLFLPLSPTLTP